MEIGKTFSVVILDMMIPGGIGGVEVARRILRIDPHANLLVSSGYTDNPVIAEYARYGFRGSLIKPYNAEQLVQAITTVCMSRPV
jgi:DNA-binding NarL/FixJ family response regulator